MSRILRVPPAPAMTGNVEADLRRLFEYAGFLERAVNQIPGFVQFLGNPNASNTTATTGTVGIDTNSASTQLLWVNTLGTPSSWSTIHYG